jgi:LPXTG-motif cell wall-anchored protein
MGSGPGSAAPPPAKPKDDGGTALLVVGGLALVAGGAWFFFRKPAPAPAPTPTPTPTPGGAHWIAGSSNPALVTPAGRGLPVPGQIPCYGIVATYQNQGVSTPIGQGPAPSIPWNTPLTQTGNIVNAPWPIAPGVPGASDWIPTNFHGCLAALADVTATA